MQLCGRSRERWRDARDMRLSQQANIHLKVNMYFKLKISSTFWMEWGGIRPLLGFAGIQGSVREIYPHFLSCGQQFHKTGSGGMQG